MRMAVTICAVQWLLVIGSIPLAADVVLSGELSGRHTFRNENVTTGGAITLTGNTQIVVLNGSITISHPIDGTGAEGEDGQDGLVHGALPTAGTPGQHGFNLSLTTFSSATAIPIPSLPRIDPSKAAGCSITLYSTIDLSGGRGGHGGSALDPPPCPLGVSDNGAPGAAGGNGGTFTACASGMLQMSTASITTNGGDGGSGGYGSPTPRSPSTIGDVAGNGANGGNAGMAGQIHLRQMQAPSDTRIQLSSSYLRAMGGTGGMGGNGGDAAHDGRQGGFPADGGDAGLGARGGNIRIRGRSVHMASAYLYTTGGTGGDGGLGGHAENAWIGELCMDPNCHHYTNGPGGTGGVAGDGADGGNVLVEALHGDITSSSTIGITITTNGGQGGWAGAPGESAAVGGSCEDVEPTPCTGRPGTAAEHGGNAGQAGNISIKAPRSTGHIAWACRIYGNGGSGQAGASGGIGAPCECGEPNTSGGAGGNGGNGKRGARLLFSAFEINLMTSIFNLNGGDGGDGGDGGWPDSFSGGGGSSGNDGQLILDADVIVDGGTIQDYAQTAGEDGEPGGACE